MVLALASVVPLVQQIVEFSAGCWLQVFAVQAVGFLVFHELLLVLELPG